MVRNSGGHDLQAPNAGANPLAQFHRDWRVVSNGARRSIASTALCCLPGVLGSGVGMPPPPPPLMQHGGLPPPNNLAIYMYYTVYKGADPVV